MKNGGWIITLSLTWFAIQDLLLHQLFSVTSFTISLSLILLSVILTVRLRLRLYLPFSINLSITLEY